MTHSRKTRGGERPLTARSVVASTLLGTTPPRLPARLLVQAGELFGIAEGTTRTALSRMVASGELEADDGWYALSGRLLRRQARQDRSRRPEPTRWDGDWLMAVVVAGRRHAADRADLRSTLTDRRLAELREGVWVRPDNLPGADEPVGAAVQWWRGRPDDGDPDALAARLWDLPGWSARAAELRARMATSIGDLEAGDTAALAPGFVLSAAVLRHFQADPLLPPALLAADWPGEALRVEYDAFDAAYRSLLTGWFRTFD